MLKQGFCVKGFVYLAADPVSRATAWPLLALLHRLYGTDVNHRPAGQLRRRTADRLDADRERRAVPQVSRQSRQLQLATRGDDAQRSRLRRPRGNGPKLKGPVARWRRRGNRTQDQAGATCSCYPAGLILLRGVKDGDKVRSWHRCNSDPKGKCRGSGGKSRGRPAPQREVGPKALGNRLCRFGSEPRLDGLPSAGRRLGRNSEARQRMEPCFPEDNCAPQLGIDSESRGDLVGLTRVEDAQHIFASEYAELLGVVGNHCSRHLRNESNPRRIQLLTLPSGALICATTSECDKPSTKASIIQRCCSGSSNLKQRRNASASAEAPILSITSGSTASSPSLGSSDGTSLSALRTASSARKRTMPVSHAAPAPRS